MNETTILRLPAVLAMTGISKSRIYEFMKRESDAFPLPLKFGIRSVGWRKSEIEEWLRSRSRGGSARS